MSGRLKSPRAWLVLGAIVAVVVLLLGWFFAIAPQRSTANTLRAEQAQAQGTSQALQAKAASLRKKAEQLPQMQAELATLSAKLPDAEQVDALIQQIQNANTATGVTVTKVSFGEPTPLAGPSAAAAPEPVTSGEASASPKAAAAPAPTLSTIDVQLTATGSAQQLLDYLNRLENLSRAMLITQVDLQQSKETGSWTLDVAATIFMRPTAATASAKPSASPSPSSSR